MNSFLIPTFQSVKNIDAVGISTDSLTGSMYCSSTYRRALASIIAEALGSTTAGDVGCDVEGGSSENRQAIWESGGICVLGI